MSKTQVGGIEPNLSQKTRYAPQKYIEEDEKYKMDLVNLKRCHLKDMEKKGG